LPQARKIDNLYRHSMAEKQSPKSEGEQLAAILNELEAAHAVKEISGWETGFPNLSRALDGILPGLYLLIGPPACGKTSLAKQLLDQVAMKNSVPGIFFSCAERKGELRIKTLARLSGVENREIRRGSAYLLHWYGVPRLKNDDSSQLPPSWEKVRRSAEEARSWLDLTYIVECGRKTTLQDLENQIQAVKQIQGRDQIIAVIDDAQGLISREAPLENRFAILADQLQATAVNLNIALFAVWPDSYDRHDTAPHAWADRIPAAEVVLVMERNGKRTEKLNPPNQAVTVRIVKNRGGARGSLDFEFAPAFSRFVEVLPS
jgi:replicative DNA helicase